MQNDIFALTLTAATLGFAHTIMGPDHYLPFIAISKARNWSNIKTFLVTVICGIGHILSSVILGILGIFFGIMLSKLEGFEGFRGNIAGWLLTAFGFVYTIWGLKIAWRNKPHTHVHSHANGNCHVHEHDHHGNHTHIHPTKSYKELTPWILFTIFIFGPCEPLIPILMYPAARQSLSGVILVTLTFAFATITTMLGIVMLTTRGLEIIKFKHVERFSQALAGFTILLCGIAIQCGL